MCQVCDPGAVSLFGGVLPAAVPGAGRAAVPHAGGTDGAAVPGGRRGQLRPAAGPCGRLSHRSENGGGPVPGRPFIPAGGGAAAGLLQQLQPGVPHQRAGRGGVRQRPGGGVAVAHPFTVRSFDGAAVSKPRRPGAAAGRRHSCLSGGIPFRRLRGRCAGEPFRDAVRLRLCDVFLCAGPAPGVSWRMAGAGAGGADGAVFPDAPAAPRPLRLYPGLRHGGLGRSFRAVPDGGGAGGQRPAPSTLRRRKGGPGPVGGAAGGAAGRIRPFLLPR